MLISSAGQVGNLAGKEPGGKGENAMQRPWLQHYPPGVPADIDPTRYPSLVAMFEESFKANAGREACVCMGKTLTYAELEAASRAFAAWLQSKGLQRGARVAIMMPNVLQYAVAIAGILRAGMTGVNVNPLYRPRELEFQLKDCGAEAIVVLENFAAVLQEALPLTDVKHIVVASMGDMLGALKGTLVNAVVRHVKKMVPAYTLPGATKFNDAIAAGGKLPFTRVAVGPDDIAFLQYTGGTTGVAKGAMLLHRNLVANVLQVVAWNEPMVALPPVIDRIIVVTALPLYHIFALTACFLFSIRTGGMCILIPNPRDIGGLIKELSHYKVNLFPAVNTLYNALLHHPDFGKLDLSMLKSAVAGGMAVQKGVAEAWMKATGKPIVEGYGLSETSPVLTCNRGDIAEWTGTIGLPVPSTEIAIRDENGHDVPIGEHGEICARGPQVMPGYWQRPDETAKVMTADSFFRTGDVGEMDAAGRVKIIDRKKDMISVSGFKVYPNEVEDVAMMQGGVLECAAIGVPDAHSGEAVKLFAVKKSPELNEHDLRQYMHSQLAGYKVPKQIEFRKELPKTNVGKILRRALRDDP
jgi:long-chain acyl-CoA synthetase